MGAATVPPPGGPPALVMVLTGALALGLAGCGRAQPPAFDAARVVKHVEQQLAFGPRVPGTAARDSAVAYLGRELAAAGADVSVQAFDIDDPYSDRPLRLMNIVANFARERTPRMLLCAHYDSRPWADQDPDSTLWSQPVPGAVDGACGAGILLEIARAIGDRDPGDVGVDIVLFDGEDYGKEGDLDYYLLGSQYFATVRGGYQPEMAILLDMVGGKGTRIRREQISEERARPVLDWVFARAAALGLDYFEATAGPPIYDDHVSLLRARIPAINLFGYDYAAWHTRGDDLSQLDRDRIDQVGRLLIDLIYSYDFEPGP